jgi:nucleoside-diphosphate-sugar epimerase
MRPWGAVPRRRWPSSEVGVSCKRLNVRYVPGPVGVQARNFSKARIKSLGWEVKVSLKEGIARTYPWIEEQVRAARLGQREAIP